MSIENTVYSPDNIDVFALDREARRLRAAEMARLGRSLRAWVASFVPATSGARAKAA